MKTAATAPFVKSIEVARGVRLQYVERGGTEGVPVIFLHGLSDSWRSYELVLPHLPGSVRAFALSQRGHGDSDRPADGYSASELARDVAAFMDGVGIERAVIVGHSMGSHIAKRFVLDYPERALGLVIIGTFHRFRGNPGVEDLSDAVVKMSDPVDPAFALEFQQSTIAKGVPTEYLDTVVEESLKVPARVWRAAIDGLIEDDHAGEISRIKTPTLIVWGDQDLFCPREDQDALTEAIAGSKLLIYSGVGHAVHWEEPERFAADLAKFIDGLER